MRRGLIDKRVLVMRSADQAEETCAALEHAGAIPVRMPLISLEPVEDLVSFGRALAAPDPGWLLVTSVNTVAALERLLARGGTSSSIVRRWRLGAVGPQTAARLQALDVGDLLMPQEHRAEGLLAALPSTLEGVRVLLPGAREMRPVLPEGLVARGARLERLVVYDNVLPPPRVWERGLAALRRGEVDAALLTSGSTARNLRRVLGENANKILARVVVASIGPVTAAGAASAGLHVDVVADPYTLAALLDALAFFLSARKLER